MPNWIADTLYAEGVEKMDIFDAEGGLDFNKIVPMPEDIQNAKADSREEASMPSYLTEGFSAGYREEAPEDLKKFGGYLSMTRLNGALGLSDAAGALTEERWERLRAIAEGADGSFAASRAAGKTYVDNIDRYGAPDWYIWSCVNWGTKWNASATRVPCRGIVTFATANASPLEVVAALSAQHPGVKFALEWQRDDTPFLTNGVEFLDGEAVREYSEEDEDLKAEWEEVTGCE